MKNMKIIIVLIFVISFIKANAQDTTRMLLKFVKPNYLGLYIAPDIQLGQLNGRFTSLGGLSAMLLVNRKWGIGVTAFQNLNESFSPKDLSPLALRAHFEGIRLEYTPDPTAAVHITFPLAFGIANGHTDSLKNENRNHHDDNDFGKRDRNRNESFIIQPGVQLEGNIIRYVKLFSGANYRFSINNKTSTLPSNTFQGFSVNAGIKIGIFDYWLRKK
jgi:hypothetical protein